MDRKAYLQALNEALSKLVPEQERAEILRYYEEYFDDVGPEGEMSVIKGLGDPRELARKLAAEAGYDVPAAEPSPRKKRRKWPWVVLGIAAVLVVMIAALAALFQVVDEVVDGDFPNVTNTQFTEEVGDPVHTYDPDDPFSAKTVRVRDETFDVVEIEAPVANVTVQTGEAYSVELEWLDDGQYALKYSLSQNSLRITGVPDSVSGQSYARVTITVPKGAALKEVDVEIGIGSVTVGNVGITDLNCEIGMGDIAWSGPLARDMELNTGMGDITITTDTIDGWKCDLNTGMGELLVDGTEYSVRYRQNGTSGELEANTGNGDIVLTTGGQ